MEKKTTTKLDVTKAAVKAAEEKAATAVKETLTETKEATKVVKEAVKEKKAAKATKKVVKEELKPEVFMQFQGKEAVVEDAIEAAKAQFLADGHRASSIKSLQIYLKPEEYAAYYVINQKFAGRVDLF